MSDYRKRLSANAEDFDSIVHGLLTDYEALKDYIDSGRSDSELVFEQTAQISQLQTENERLKGIISEVREWAEGGCSYVPGRICELLQDNKDE